LDKAIITVLLIICGVITSMAIFNGLYPAVLESSSAIDSASNQLSDQIRSDIEIIQVSPNGTIISAWVKNVGTNIIEDIPGSDLFIGSEIDYTYVNYGGSTTPYWTYQIQGSATAWSQTVTIKITATLESSLAPGMYIFKLITPNGTMDQITFSVS
jgi:archaellum component FlaG (FlaF/FlaG flagellin family)